MSPEGRSFLITEIRESGFFFLHEPDLKRNVEARMRLYEEKRGVLYDMAARKIPVIHLLYIKGLVERYGLSWDPIPLPQPGKGKIYQLVGKRQSSFLFLAAAYFLLVIMVLVFRNKLGLG
ncbi:MAG TPA: hypothetical protein ENI02_02320 [Candidatus Aminicenantes bacterium]|nr:hypothetical protein [Candidatus Aminicenantes bacterium]